MLVCLFAVFLSAQVASWVIFAKHNMSISGGEYVLSGAHLCNYNFDAGAELTVEINWILGIVREILTMCLAVWIAIKHFRELQRPLIGAVGDCFAVSIQTHVFYFAR
ncbi:hypothetical protein K503DRAFT_774921 [Rhizopogon vinicolor AM-OR11-026]|uniref:Chitin synthase export chaperone n=1 Tax=Rhizopogon vinicolor AM-OR11-026 TaxID=1314800 RepID=A0A1B7MND2_9AGAM|nr:hypothetical protein K503DRAFT_774921 [Rhizopogon vinicolor AM-OR11-026]